MNRNTELHFSETPQISLKRSKFEMSHSIKSTMNAGDVVPLFVDADILPGDTVQMDMAELVRMATPIYPIMDNLYADIYWFFVPHRLVWEHWQAFWGENDDPWTQTTEYEIPQITAPEGGWTEGTIADYMGIPTKVGNISVNAMPFRAYCKIWNDWFRDENLKSNCHIYMDETTRVGQNGTEEGYDYVTGTEFGGAPAKVAKFHDYFTSALPQPQKGDPVSINIDGGIYPVKTGEVKETYETGSLAYPLVTQVGNLDSTTSTTQTTMTASKRVGWTNNTYPISGSSSGVASAPLNLYADLSNATVMTINQLRTAFAIQKYYENAGLHGRKA